MTSALGIGTSPLGTGAYGDGTPATVPTPGGLVNMDSRGQQLGSLQLSLEPGSVGQYVFDDFGRRVGMADVSHMVILALTTIRQSSAQKNLGHRFFEVRKVTDKYAAEQTTRVEQALGDLVSRNLITIDSIVVIPQNGAPSITRIYLTDLTRNVPIDFAI